VRAFRFPGRIARGTAVLGLLCAFTALESCSSGPPEILGVEWTLESRPMTGGTDRSVVDDLAVFARVHDADGMDDIEALWIINDAKELSWTFGPSSWSRKSLGSDDWLGASGLTMPDASGPPPGRYRIVVADLAGNRASYDFTLGNYDDSKGLPLPDWKEGRVGLAKPWPENYLVAYDSAGSLIRSVVFPAAGGSLASLVGTVDAKRTQAFALYGYDPVARRGAFSKRILVK